MPDIADDAEAPRWGRPPRRKPRGPKEQSGPSDSGGVGPIEDEATLASMPMIVRASGEPASARASAPPADPDPGDHALRDLVAHMARGIVDHPDDVSVQILEPGQDAEFELRVHPDDIGHVIGKQGRTARSLRLALGAAAARIGRKAGLEIAD